jgi:hypothetical protein
LKQGGKMKKFSDVIFISFILALLLLGNFCSKSSENAVEDTGVKEMQEKAGEEDLTLQSESFVLKHPNSEDNLTVNAKIPATWMRNPDFGAVVFQPENYADYFFPPIIQYTISCGGNCDPEIIPDNIENSIKEIIKVLSQPNINTGDPEMDAIRANVTILKEENFGENGWILAAVVTYPEKLSSVLYVPKFVIHAYSHHPGDSFYVQTTARTGFDEKDKFMDVLLEACKSTDY